MDSDMNIVLARAAWSRGEGKHDKGEEHLRVRIRTRARTNARTRTRARNKSRKEDNLYLHTLGQVELCLDPGPPLGCLEVLVVGAEQLLDNLLTLLGQQGELGIHLQGRK